jgi:2-dehydro-3-deoxyphosphooctonate aldolase (KDO 8-P synthase)
MFDYSQPIFILGPCVIESLDLLEEVATEVVRLRDKYAANFIFKSSFDKANRTSLESFRGQGMERGLEALATIKQRYNLPITTDIHESYQADPVSEVADVLQIPAFLCRQTDLLIAAARTDRIVNVKKAQFLSGDDMYYAVQKVRDAGNPDVWLTERGNMYGYNNLVVDFRNIPAMKAFGQPVIMDCTHAVQRPGGAGGATAGNREFVPPIALAAKAFGADGYFMEVHPDPEKAKSDGPNMVYLKDVENLVASLIDE